MSGPTSKGAVLNTAFNNFLFVDNGTVGKCDTDIIFRRQLEEKLSNFKDPGLFYFTKLVRKQIS